MVWASYIQNYYSIPHPISPPFHNIISIRKALKLCPSTQCQIIWYGNFFRQAPKDSSSIVLWNNATKTTCYSNLYHIMFLHHCEKLKSRTSIYTWQECGWFMLGKLNDKYHIIFFTIIVFNAAVLCTISVLQFLLLPQIKERNEI